MRDMVKYEIRELDTTDLKPALKLIEEVFIQFEAPGYSELGIKTFENFIEFELIRDMLERGLLEFFGCFNNNQIIGVIATRQKNHICMFFVDSKYHKQGIGKSLFEKVESIARNHTLMGKITVNSSPYAVEIYQKLGFEAISVEQDIDGIRFTPMEYKIVRK